MDSTFATFASELNQNCLLAPIILVHGPDNFLLPVTGTKSNNTFWRIWYMWIMFHYDSNLETVAYAQKNINFNRYPIST